MLPVRPPHTISGHTCHKLMVPDIAGRTISPGEWTAANTYVHAWAKSQDGAYACYTAIECESPSPGAFDWQPLDGIPWTE